MKINETFESTIITEIAEFLKTIKNSGTELSEETIKQVLTENQFTILNYKFSEIMRLVNEWSWKLFYYWLK